MTEMELRDIVKKTVDEHGPEKATNILMDMVDKDRDMMFAAARYGMGVAFAPLIAEAAADGPKH